MLQNKQNLNITDSFNTLSGSEIDEVAGGPLPVLALAVAATTVQFSFIRGVFDGIREKETANPRGR
jgi:hypothetical protein